MLEEECLIMNRTKYGNSNATVKQNNSMEKSGPRCSQISEREWLKTAIPEEIICANQGFLLSKSVLIGFYYTFTHWQVQLMPFYHFFVTGSLQPIATILLNCLIAHTFDFNL